MILPDSSKLAKAFELSFDWNIPDFILSKSYNKVFYLPEKCGVENMFIEMNPVIQHVPSRLVCASIQFLGSDIRDKTFSFVAQSKKGGAVSVHRQVALQPNKVYSASNGFIHIGNVSKCCDMRRELGLKIEVTITSFGYRNSEFGLTKSMNSLLLLKDFSDYTFIVNYQHKVQAHKAVLSARSPYFNRLFTDVKAATMMTINDISIGAFESFLHFMYTNEIEILENHVEDLLTISGYYEIKGLKEACDKKLSEKREGDFQKNSELIVDMKTANASVAQAPEMKTVEENSKVISITPFAEEKSEATVETEEINESSVHYVGSDVIAKPATLSTDETIEQAPETDVDGESSAVSERPTSNTTFFSQVESIVSADDEDKNKSFAQPAQIVGENSETVEEPNFNTTSPEGGITQSESEVDSLQADGDKLSYQAEEADTEFAENDGNSELIDKPATAVVTDQELEENVEQAPEADIDEENPVEIERPTSYLNSAEGMSEDLDDLDVAEGGENE